MEDDSDQPEPDEARIGDPASDGADDHRDQLPEDLDISGLVGPYEFPNNSKRRVASVLYLVIGAICIWLGTGVESALVNGGFTVVGVGLILFAIYSWIFAVETKYDETDALVVAAKTVGFAPGPASAQMTWLGWRSRPTWRVLLYSAEAQPLHRALVVVDAVDGNVREHLVEDNPEDWSEL